jgi:hypothetical protein
MPRLTCRSCGFETDVSELVGELGMNCPRCECGPMRKEEDPNSRLARWRRKQIKPPKFRTGQIRNLIFGIIFIVVGPLLILLGISLPHWAMRLTVSLAAAGSLMILAGIFLMTWGFITGKE